MSETVNKFLNYLQERHNEILKSVMSSAVRSAFTDESSIVVENTGYSNFKDIYIRNTYDDEVNEMAEIKRFIRLLSTPKEEWDKSLEVFIDFDKLEIILRNSTLRIKEQVDIIMTMLERNLATSISSNVNLGFDMKAIENYEFKTMSKNEASEMIYSGEYVSLGNLGIENIPEDKKAKFQELFDFIENHPVSIDSIKELHKLIFEHYFNKVDSFDYKDIDVIIMILKEFKISDEYANLIRNVFVKGIKKREQAKEVFVTGEFQRRVEENRISEKEYNLLNRELRKYFDLDNMIAREPLDLEKQIYCVSLMMRMRIDNKVIKQALKIMNRDYKYLSGQSNSIALFCQLYDKLSYYEEIDGVEDAIKQIQEFMQEIFICNDEDYVFWRSVIGEELSKVNELIPDIYEYEIEEAKKLVKLNK